MMTAVTIGYMDPGKWSAVFGMSLRDLYCFDAGIHNHHGRIINEVRTQAGAGGLADGRNYITERFLEHDNEWLFMVDTDMGFAEDTLERLIDSADAEVRPVMGALCFQLYDTEQWAPYGGKRFGIMPTLYESMDAGYRHIPDYKRDAVIRVDATGGACLLIHRRVMQQMQNDMGSVWFMQMPGYSEDLSFMRRCSRLDIPIHVNTSVKTTHDKGALFLDEGSYDLSRPWAQQGWVSE